METQTKSVVEILKQPECLALTQKLKNFISTSYQHPKPITSQRRATIKFLDSLYSDCVKLPIFKELSETPQGRLKIREGLEKLTTTKIHDLVFGAPMTDEPMVCAHFELKITEFTWVQERHLDLPFEITSKLSTASTELHKVADYRAPKDKLTILNNTLQIVVDIIQSNSGAAGNDQLLPVLVLLLLKCSPPKIISHIRYVIRFRSAEELNKGHNQYCLTSLMGAISFIYNMTPESLTLSKEETNVMIKPPSALKISTKSKSISVELSEVSPLQENFYRTPSDMESPHIVQIGELASHVYGQTTGFLGQIFKEVKVATDNATGAVDAVLDSVLGVPDESSSRDSNSTIQSRPSTMISSDSQNNSDSRNRNMPGTPKITQSNINQTNLDHSDSAQDIYLPTQSIYLPEDTSQNWWSTIKKNTSLPDFKFFNNDPNSAKTSASVSTATSPTTDRYPGDASFVNPIHSNISHKASNSQPRNHSNLQFSSDVDTPLTNEDYELQLAIALSKSTYIDENEREALLEDRELIEAMVQSAKESGNPLDLITFESGEDVRAAQDSNVKQNIVQIDKDVNI